MESLRQQIRKHMLHLNTLIHYGNLSVEFEYKAYQFMYSNLKSNINTYQDLYNKVKLSEIKLMLLLSHKIFFESDKLLMEHMGDYYQQEILEKIYINETLIYTFKNYLQKVGFISNSNQLYIPNVKFKTLELCTRCENKLRTEMNYVKGFLDKNGIIKTRCLNCGTFNVLIPSQYYIV